MAVKNHRLIDPDPVTVALTVLGVVGTLATIADAIQNRIYRLADDRTRAAQVSRELLRLSAEIESSVNSLQVDYETIKDIFYRNLELLPNSEQLKYGALGDPFVLGQFKLFLSERDFANFSKAHQGIARQSVEVIRDTYNLISSIRREDVEITEKTYDKIVTLRSRANRLLGERLTYEEGLGFLSDLLDFSSEVCRDIKREFLPGMPPAPQRVRFGG